MTRSDITGIGALVFVLSVWAFLANRNPTLTYHFAPLIAVLVWPYLSRDDVTAAGSTARAGLSNLAVSAVAFALAGAGRMEGPTFWGSGAGFFNTPLFEALLFASIGAVGWAGFSLRNRTATPPPNSSF